METHFQFFAHEDAENSGTTKTIANEFSNFLCFKFRPLNRSLEWRSTITRATFRKMRWCQHRGQRPAFVVDLRDKL